MRDNSSSDPRRSGQRPSGPGPAPTGGAGARPMPGPPRPGPGQPQPGPAQPRPGPTPKPPPGPAQPRPGPAQPQPGSPEDATATGQEGIWDAERADEFRHRWHDVQTHFVENPSGSLTEARQLLDEAVQELTTSVRNREEELERSNARASDSTEGMRSTVLQYHQLLDRLLSV
ncbi:hypothetical protein [Dactylosporangium sp. CA-092794]|uniref:hypothetical protein n=1 Tax=Dactylosporangium sp. CA-092794 TaxID=3239929 RepID=UPI003D8BFC73